MSKKTILFVAEDVTLAQLVRLKVLATSLDKQDYNIHFASATHPQLIFKNTNFIHWPLNNIGAEKARQLIQGGKRLYEEDTLENYVKADFKIIERIQPDLIVGDFRLSLSISAPLNHVPYAALINAYWSPYFTRKEYPMPDHPVEKLLNLSVARKIFPFIRPWIFRHFCQPFNQVRKKYGLKSIDGLPEVLTSADFVLYADTELLCPSKLLPAHHQYLGPILWSPEAAISSHMKALLDEPYIYVTLGSSGRTDRYNELFNGLAKLPYKILLSTAGRKLPKAPGNVVVADFVPGDLAARNSLMVICNGGSTTGYQALYEGKPVIGLASNLDQYLCMKNLEKLGAGILLRAGSFHASSIQTAVAKILQNERYYFAASKIQQDLHQHDCKSAFRGFVSSTLN